MRCIFCKNPSDKCVSVEHIIPESLGNTEHVLPKGWVCDTCNNYFAREIEKPFLDSLYGHNSRFEMNIPNKRGRIPAVTGFHLQSQTEVELSYPLVGGELSVGALREKDTSRWIQSLQSNSQGTLYIPTAVFPDVNTITSRFIGKVALEALALRCINVLGTNDEIVNKPELNELRRYVRIGQPPSIWPIHIRRIYPADFGFLDAKYGKHQILHEWMIHHIPESEYYVIVAIFGVEYAINLGGPELEGYQQWLKDNNSASPLYKESAA